MSCFADNHEALRYFVSIATKKHQFRRLSSAQSFYLCGNSDFYMRLNAWYPQGNATGERLKRLKSYFAIDECHNHAVDFFTVGVFGPGYTTEFRVTRRDLSNFQIGDRIEFDDSWSEQLVLGKALFVPKTTHFHTQFHPAEYSISLNLVIAEDVKAVQYTLDRDRATVKDIFDLIGVEQRPTALVD